MTLRARPASDTPEQALKTIECRTGLRIPGDGEKRENRLAALGPLAGIAVGVGIGAAVRALAATGVRLPWGVHAPLVGAFAMVATDLPMAVSGISDPREWSREDWLSDVIAHLAYGLATTATLAAVRKA